MKKMMMALAALCVAGAASAVTFDWTKATTVDTSTWSNGRGTTSINVEGSFAVRATLNIASLTGGSGWPYVLFVGDYGIRVAGADETKEDGAVVYKTGYYYVGAVEGDMHAVNDKVQMNTGDVTFELRYDATTDTLTMFAGNTELGSISGLTYSGETLITVGAQVDNSGNNQFSSVANYTITSVEYTATTIPEPTALALLALGVAGLALRRKAA